VALSSLWLLLQKCGWREGKTLRLGPFSYLRAFAWAASSAENACPHFPPTPCFPLSHSSTRASFCPCSQPPNNFLRYSVIYSFVLFVFGPPFFIAVSSTQHTVGIQ
jgi:hypothetical protein